MITDCFAEIKNMKPKKFRCAAPFGTNNEHSTNIIGAPRLRLQRKYKKLRASLEVTPSVKKVIIFAYKQYSIMRTSNTDTLRLQVLQDVMELDDDSLRKLHEAMLLASRKKNPILYDILHSSAHELQEENSVYTTKEVMRDIDEEMGWK